MTLRPPSTSERHLVARCLFDSEALIGSEDEIWTHPDAMRALGTFRECIDAITLLIGGKHGVAASFVKACVMQADGITSIPFMLDDVAEFLTTNGEARAYWQSLCQDDRFPHRCPWCGAAAFWGFLQIECKANCRG